MKDKENRFNEVLREKILALPYDLKICFAIMADEDCDREVRLLAAGTALYVLGPNDIIPDHIMPVGYADDAIILWAALDRIRTQHPEVAAKFSERFDGIIDRAGETVEAFSAYLGKVFDWMLAKVPSLPELVYKGKKAAEYIEDPEAGVFLYEEGLAFVTDFDLDEDYLANALRGRKVLEALTKRIEEEEARRK
ncbi:MAG: DUF1232 domain-containing protein [Polyangia bacterium]|jgi:uncharacterized membrane protein YkvA (DUF1232 family)|nr:DUF1232 domain-containing protein [Polyangia bacterium]